jgi:hypothetical protein
LFARSLRDAPEWIIDGATRQALASIGGQATYEAWADTFTPHHGVLIFDVNNADGTVIGHEELRYREQTVSYVEIDGP